MPIPPRPEPSPTPEPELDAALETLRQQAPEWASTPIEGRLELLKQLRAGFLDVAEEWADACARAEGLRPGTPRAGEEWLVGPYLIQRNLRLLEEALEDIRVHGRPRIPGPVRTRAGSEGEQVTAEVFPASLWDKVMFPGVTAEVWMEPGLHAEDLANTQARAYRPLPASAEEATGADADGVPLAGVALVLGAGNVSSIGPTDALYKFFVENRVVIYKMHPVNAYLGPLMVRACQSLVDGGFLRVVYGGAEVGDYLCTHENVDEIHITGSDKTVEAIAFGTGEEAERRKAEKNPRIDKTFTAELGNVSALIVVPGPWDDRDFAYQAENIASSLTNNAGFNCNATRVIVQHAGWEGRGRLLDGVRGAFEATRARDAYYPGADDRYGRFLEAHPNAETLGEAGEDQLPWTLIPDLSPDAEGEICYSMEAFCGLTSETALEAADAAEFLDRAVDFANDKLWGTLNVTLVIHPKSLRDPATQAAFERALANLRFGTVSVNHWAGVCFGLMTSTWGAFPGHDLYHIESGFGVVHNTLMFGRPQKTVVRAPFRAWPKPPWFSNHASAHKLGRALTEFEAHPSVWKLPEITWHGLGS